MSVIRRKDLTGRVFGNLTVIGFAGKQADTCKSIWMCECSCGNKIEVLSSTLISGLKTHCGCIKPKRGIRKIKPEVVEEEVMDRKTYLELSGKYLKQSMSNLKKGRENLALKIELDNKGKKEYFSSLGQVLNSLEILMGDLDEIIKRS